MTVSVSKQRARGRPVREADRPVPARLVVVVLLLLLLLLLLTLGACASSGGSEGGSRGGRANVLTREQLLATEASNLFLAVRNLRPNWLRARSSTMSGPDKVVVFVDQMQVGEVEFMEGMSIEGVREVEYVSATDATTRWGTGFPAGVILIHTGS